MSQRWTKELQSVVGKLERNKNGLVKVVSALEYLKDVREERSVVLGDTAFTLIQERRNLRLVFTKELDRQDQWARNERS